MTSIRVGNHVGYADYGKKSRQEMIESYRRIAELEDYVASLERDLAQVDA